LDSFCGGCGKLAHPVSLSALREPFLRKLEVVGLQHVHAPLPALQTSTQRTYNRFKWIAIADELKPTC
jgi:hypothetical protein